MDHFQSPRNAGRLDLPSAVGNAGTPGSGPYMVFYLVVVNQVIETIRYQTYGCGSAIAAGSVLTTLVENQSVDECLLLTPEKLIEAMDGIPEDKRHCAALAIEALRDGLQKIT